MHLDPPGPPQQPLPAPPKTALHLTTVTLPPLSVPSAEASRHILGFSSGAGDREEPTFTCSDPGVTLQTGLQALLSGPRECPVQLGVFYPEVTRFPDFLFAE